MTLTQLAIDLLNAARKLDEITAAEPTADDGFDGAMGAFDGVLASIEKALGRA
jgi:hypothetical protein